MDGKPSSGERPAQAAGGIVADVGEASIITATVPGRAEGSPVVPAVEVRGARVHNLKNIDCEIPLYKLTVVTGVSGSGKSSLAFDTVYAEGQRRYVESLSAYARQFLERIEKPDVDEVAGIAPAVAIRQKNATRNPRSTVATTTEIYDYLRLLFARAGVTFCPNCQVEVHKDSVDEVADRVLAHQPIGRKFYILFEVRPTTVETKARPVGSLALPARLGEKKRAERPARAKSPSTDGGAEALKARLFSLRQIGFNRLYQDGRVFEFSNPESLLDIDFSRPVFILVDRLAISPDIRQRLIDSLELCYRETGEAVLEIVGEAGADTSERLVFNERFECKRCSKTFEDPEPRLFSFNNPYGACPRCQGFGNTIDFDLDRVIPDKGKTLGGGAVEPWTKPRYRAFQAEMKQAALAHGIPLNVPYHRLDAQQRRWLLEGGDGFPGIRGFFRHLERKKYKLHVRVFLSRYRAYTLCSACQGGRLRAEAGWVRVAGKTVNEVVRMSVEEAFRFFNELRLGPDEMAVAEKILEEIRSRLKFLYKVGLEYLTLDRLAATLAGGEAQRIQLATALGSNLVGALYVLDEPSIGLHPRDTSRLIEILKNLRDIGNTVLVVEHDAEMMREADRILDLGPGAGEHGGQVVYSGGFEGLLAHPRSLTGRYLGGQLEIPVPEERRPTGKAWLRIRGARAHNLKSVDVDIPLGLMVAVSGVSGSGKSTLVHDVLANTLLARRGELLPRADVDRVEGDAALDSVVLVDQSPLGRTPRSNPLTAIKAFDAVRMLFASTPEARKRGYAPGHFSFNIPGGRCETCQGDGTVTVEMQFLADVELVCEECRGRRFKPAVLEIHYKGKSIHDVIQMTVREALIFFAGHPRIISKLRVLDEVGLGYLRLGQSATTLSGGEAQRVRLTAHLADEATEHTLFIFDEPTTGLHFDDIHKLLTAFRKLIEAGATVLVIEHNLDVLKTADWLIDLGPEGGDAGGLVVHAGPPEEVVKNPHSHTGRYLAPYLGQRKSAARNACP
ncbi:MAG: excinuclease ABC subunit A [Acidobacteria bacterium]|nr:MAG: excinuclease ABC subunit A [Acidobacteriota bacterium]